MTIYKFQGGNVNSAKTMNSDTILSRSTWAFTFQTLLKNLQCVLKCQSVHYNENLAVMCNHIHVDYYMSWMPITVSSLVTLYSSNNPSFFVLNFQIAQSLHAGLEIGKTLLHCQNIKQGLAIAVGQTWT